MPDGYRPAMPQVRDMDELFGTHRSAGAAVPIFGSIFAKSFREQPFVEQDVLSVQHNQRQPCVPGREPISTGDEQ
jgi:hypothetical protein